MFLREFPVLRKALERGTPREAQLAAHSLKSSAQHMGAMALAERMAELERRLGEPGAAVAAGDLEAVDRDFEAQAASLRAFAGE